MNDNIHICFFFFCRLYDSVRHWQRSNEFEYPLNDLPVLMEESLPILPQKTQQLSQVNYKHSADTNIIPSTNKKVKTTEDEYPQITNDISNGHYDEETDIHHLIANIDNNNSENDYDDEDDMVSLIEQELEKDEEEEE